MLKEIGVAIDFILGFSTNNTNERSLSPKQVNTFKHRLSLALMQRFMGHWYPKQPWRGQAYRCIRINRKTRVDKFIDEACRAAGFNYESLNLPIELTIWIDPSDVSCRFGEKSGSYCSIYTTQPQAEKLSEEDQQQIDKTIVHNIEQVIAAKSRSQLAVPNLTSNKGPQSDVPNDTNLSKLWNGNANLNFGEIHNQLNESFGNLQNDLDTSLQPSMSQYMFHNNSDYMLPNFDKNQHNSHFNMSQPVAPNDLFSASHQANHNEYFPLPTPNHSAPFYPNLNPLESYDKNYYSQSGMNTGFSQAMASGRQVPPPPGFHPNQLASKEIQNNPPRVSAPTAFNPTAAPFVPGSSKPNLPSPSDTTKTTNGDK